MNDRELLELAAKAAGYASWYFLAGEDGNLMNVYTDDGRHYVWCPLESDGDALRLAVRLCLEVYGRDIGCRVNGDDGEFIDIADCGWDAYAATRRAIVRAAAAIGEAMQ